MTKKKKKSKKKMEEELGRLPSSPAMDPSIWSKLPEDLLLRVLSLLPVHSLVSLRPTCKLFSSLLSSPFFLSIVHSLRRQRHHLLLLSHPQFFQLLPSFSPSTSSWCTLNLPSSLRLLSSSSSGILCFSIHPHSSSLLLANPLSCSSRTLPAPFNPILSVTILPSPPYGYTLLLTTGSPFWVFLYHSQTGSWTKIRGTNMILHDQPGALYANSVYFTTCGEPLRVVGLDLAERSWRAVEAELPPLTFARVVSSGERLYLVGGLGGNGIARALRVWGMEGGRWVEVGRLPEMMWRKLAAVCFHKYEHLSCLWVEDAVCIGCVTWPEVLRWMVCGNTWHWLPVCPMLPEKWSCGFRWFPFSPNLYTLV